MGGGWGRDGGARAPSLTPQSLAGSGSFVLLEKCTSGIGGLESIQNVIEDKFLFDVGVNMWLQNVSKVSTTLDKRIYAACAILQGFARKARICHWSISGTSPVVDMTYLLET